MCARTQEFGVKLALGATRRELLLAILREGAMLSLGWHLAWPGADAVAGAARYCSVPANDVASFAAVAALLVVVILAACLVPARRAASVDPQAAYAG